MLPHPPLAPALPGMQVKAVGVHCGLLKMSTGFGRIFCIWIYTFKILAITILIYLLLIPVSYLHFQKLKKKKNIDDVTDDAEDLEDIL